MIYPSGELYYIHITLSFGEYFIYRTLLYITCFCKKYKLLTFWERRRRKSTCGCNQNWKNISTIFYVGIKIISKGMGGCYSEAGEMIVIIYP